MGPWPLRQVSAGVAAQLWCAHLDGCSLQDGSLTKIDIDRQKVERICKAKGIARLVAFGSAARGEVTSSSDIDLIAPLPADASLLDLVRIERELFSARSREVDLLTEDSISPNPARTSSMPFSKWTCTSRA